MSTVKLAFTAYGSPTAKPLIILHGFFASSRNWRLIAEQLANDYYVIVPDLRNHGASPHHECMDYPSMSADLSALIADLGFAEISLLGHSMGGKVAMWYALHHPERVAKLLIADISPVAYSHSFAKLINALHALPLDRLTNRKQAENFLAEAIPDLSYRQFLLQNLILEAHQYRWRINLEIFRANADYITGFPDTASVSAYTKPVLFLAGAMSDYVKPDSLPELFPNAIIEKIAGAAHWLHVQQPRLFLAEVRRFL